MRTPHELENHPTDTNSRVYLIEVAERLGQDTVMHRFIFACLVLALTAQGACAEEQTASGSSAWDTEFDITPDDAQNNDVFNVVVIGDSVAWGTGLNKNEKYSYLVADWLKTQLDRPVHVKILAHTGATIDRVPCDSTSPTDYPPELSSGRPTLMEQADMITNPKEVDLILVSGGANDVNLDKLLMLDYGSAKNEIGVGCLKLFTIGSTVDDIRKRSEDIKTPMSRLLTKLLDECPNSKIIVTGYYSGVSQKSEGLTEAVAALVPISQNPITKGYQKLDEKAQKDQLVTKSALFRRVSGDSLEEATNDANDNIGTNRVAFARIFFPPEKCYGTDQSWLWKIDNSNNQVKTNDNMFTTRVALLKELDKYCECGPCADSESTPLTLSIPSIDSENTRSTLPISSGIDCSKYLRDKLDAVGHPNVDGAKNYSESIIREIGAAWPTWLYPTVQAFDVSSRSLTSGESLEITYTVSDNGSGLKQVELWRKDEQSDWQEIKPPNTLAGENGPIFGSFTDSPLAPGKYWYGLHVVDNAGNWNDEKNSNTNGLPSYVEPAEVEVMGNKHTQTSPAATLEKDSVGNSILQTIDGSYILAGWTELTDAENSNAWMIKTDFEGREEWNRTFGRESASSVSSIQSTSDGGYILAGYSNGGTGSGDAWLIKTDTDGNEFWNKTFGIMGSYDNAFSVQQTNDGGYIIAGATRRGVGDAWLIKTDANGNELWNRSFLGEFSPHALAKQTDDGGYILTRSVHSYGWPNDTEYVDFQLINIDANGDELWNKTLVRSYCCDCSSGECDESQCNFCAQESSVWRANDNGYIIAGITGFYREAAEPNAIKSQSIWLTKTDADGNQIWNRTFKEVSTDYCKCDSVQQTYDGGYILIGACINGDYLIKTDASGNKLWYSTLKVGGLNADISQTKDGGYIIIGTTFAANHRVTQLIKTDVNGNMLWFRQFEGPSAD